MNIWPKILSTFGRTVEAADFRVTQIVSALTFGLGVLGVLALF
jgi:hypothetical protein